MFYLTLANVFFNTKTQRYKVFFAIVRYKEQQSCF